MAASARSNAASPQDRDDHGAADGAAPPAADGQLLDDAPLGLPDYLDALSLIERLHRLLLDVVKDEFERLGQLDINAVQALLLFNVGDNEVSAGELKTRGYYQGSNVSYNLKKLVESGYMSHERSAVDRRAVRVRLTAKGRGVRDIVAGLFARHAVGVQGPGGVTPAELYGLTDSLRRIERFWASEIRYIY
ncbi:MarR family winged helix-turn-helix transcriptional regulator [Oceanomicrobium pacificus]|uniref:Winged helix DNA-binding protein n=1 Tax=Oceanomicrobium pacificus TaxID=2692916 RepID=A0A6B0TSI3_9RHOB|nr:MarR family transcriptional regulator [Oceanomicrobium pacificus]MXU65699.1 winged helix DNA-binding protein [Oceanomicrobium pacificus]